MKNVISFEEFEQAVIKKILENDTPINVILREQYKKAQVINREFSGVGFFTYFKIPENVSRVMEPIARGYGNLICDINGIKDFGGFVLFIENGVITYLEGYTFNNEWPPVITSYKLHK